MKHVYYFMPIKSLKISNGMRIQFKDLRNSRKMDFAAFANFRAKFLNGEFISLQNKKAVCPWTFEILDKFLVNELLQTSISIRLNQM